MKNVIIYKRVSSDEQAEGYSLESQDDRLRKYCDNHNLVIIESYVEDYSAKEGFERPAYNELRKFIKNNKGAVDGILFTQWSRFARDSNAASNEIKRLRKIGTEPNAIEQWIDYSVPESLYMLSIYLAAPQVENERLSLRTIDGMRKACKSGKWQGSAPYGYYHNKAHAQADKALIVDQAKAELVQESFKLFGTGLFTCEAVRKSMSIKGLKKSKQAFLDMLANIAYTGKIKLAAYKDEPAQLVSGLHPGIISTELFQTVQNILAGKKKPFKGLTKSTELHLVGHLYCPTCERPMTGSGSRGNGGVYHYYHCQRKYGCKNAFKADKANSTFKQYLHSFQPKANFMELYSEVLKDVFNSSGKGRENEKIKLKKEIEIISEKMEKAAYKNLDGVLEDSLFKQLAAKMETERYQIATRLNRLNTMAPEFEIYLLNSKAMLGNMVNLYEAGTVEAKKKIIGSIFPEKIYFSENEYRTTKINEVVALMCSGRKGLNENSPAKNARLSSSAPPVGLEPTTL